MEKGWRFVVKTAEANRIYNALGEIETIARRLQTVYIDHLDFRRCIKNWDRSDTFFFLDPPYLETVPYRRGLPPFTLKDHQDLAALLQGVRGKWLVTCNDVPEVRELYRDYSVTAVATKLQTFKVAVGDKRPPHKQLLIRNYKLRE